MSNSWFRFNPYHVQFVKQECSCPSSTVITPRSSAAGRLSDCGSSMRSTPQTDSIAPIIESPVVLHEQQEPLPFHPSAAVGAVHRQVLSAEGVAFLPFPSTGVSRPSHWPAFPTIDGPFPDLRVFIGQCRFETTAEEIAFVLWHTASLAPHSIARHRPGCFVANFLKPEDVETCVRLLHRNILFDVCGVWVARNRTESDAMKRYVATSPLAAFKRHRVPRGLVVAEHFRSFQQQTSSAVVHHHHHVAAYQPLPVSFPWAAPTVVGCCAPVQESLSSSASSSSCSGMLTPTRASVSSDEGLSSVSPRAAASYLW